MRDSHARLLWTPKVLAWYGLAGLEFCRETRGYPYRRILQALRGLHDDGLIAKYVSGRNESVYYLYERDAKYNKEKDDIPF